MRHTPSVAIVNHSSVISDAEVADAIPAFRRQVGYHFRPYWDSTCTISQVATDIEFEGSWVIAILDDSDMAGALGYHDMTADGLPLAKVFAKTDKLYGLSWTVTLTHELLEMLVDPFISEAWQVTNEQFYAVEVCDPVEADHFGYHITTPKGSNILVSNFITPAWFMSGYQGAWNYDYLNVLKSPLEIANGGYMSIYTSGKGWAQKQMKGSLLVDVPLEADNPRFRDRSSGMFKSGKNPQGASSAGSTIPPEPLPGTGGL